MRAPTFYHRMKSLNALMIRNYRRGFGPIRIILLLTTTGRKSGRAYTTSLQYEEVAGDFYVASARGPAADWFKNALKTPLVHVQIRQREFDAIAEPVTDPTRLADFLALRLRRHPIMVRLIMHIADGLPLRFSRQDLEKISDGKVMLILHPIQPPY